MRAITEICMEIKKGVAVDCFIAANITKSGRHNMYVSLALRPVDLRPYCFHTIIVPPPHFWQFSGSVLGEGGQYGFGNRSELFGELYNVKKCQYYSVLMEY